jgi:hypothetical protein
LQDRFGTGSEFVVVKLEQALLASEGAGGGNGSGSGGSGSSARTARSKTVIGVAVVIAGE